MTLPGTGLTPAELNSSDGQSANVGAAGPCRLHWRYVTTQLSSLVRDCSKPLQTRSQARTSTVMLQATGQGWCSPACRPTHPGPLCSEIMVLTSRQDQCQYHCSFFHTLPPHTLPPHTLPPHNFIDDLSVTKGTRRDLLLFDTSYKLSLSKFGPVSLSSVVGGCSNC